MDPVAWRWERAADVALIAGFALARQSDLRRRGNSSPVFGFRWKQPDAGYVGWLESAPAEDCGCASLGQKNLV